MLAGEHLNCPEKDALCNGQSSGRFVDIRSTCLAHRWPGRGPRLPPLALWWMSRWHLPDVARSLDRSGSIARIGRMTLSNDPSVVLEREQLALKPPPLYKVLLLNDDFTPMDFVVQVLQKFFSMSLEKATDVMLQVHHEGRGVCGMFPRDIALTKVEQVSGFARQHQHPLQCVMEEA